MSRPHTVFNMQSLCNNCGERGHAFRECTKPVLSCGILLIRNKREPKTAPQLPLHPDDVEVLMLRRKDSMSFTEFMRGKYDPNDPVYVIRLLENMTQSELHSLQNYSFSQNWNRMWNYADRHEHEYVYASEKFKAIAHIIPTIHSAYSEPEWGFPKGRRYRVESDLQCAEREFFEETNIPRSEYLIVNDVAFTETFLGTNGVPYAHKYFLALQLHESDILKKFTILQKREISAIAWQNLENCLRLTRPHYSGRKQLLEDVVKFVETIEVRTTRK